MYLILLENITYKQSIYVLGIFKRKLGYNFFDFSIIPHIISIFFYIMLAKVKKKIRNHNCITYQNISLFKRLQ